MSRSVRSIRSRAPSCRRISSRSSVSSERPCCSSPTTCARRSCSGRRSRCSTTAASCRKAPSRTSRVGLGGTGIAFGALASGEIDVYPEYTGTISRAILKDASVTTIDALRSRLRPLGLTISDPLGFANTYALAVARATATRLGLRTISDLARHPGLTAAFDPGFIDRDDGWRGLRRHYGLPLTRVTGMEHALTYQA